MYGRRSLLARPILQEYDAFTVELVVNPAKFGNLANRTTLSKSQKLVGGKRTIANGDEPSLWILNVA